MAIERSRGASRREIASAAWSWRRRLSGANIADLRTLLRPVALFVLPLPAIRLVRRAKRWANAALEILLDSRKADYDWETACVWPPASPLSDVAKAWRSPRRPS